MNAFIERTIAFSLFFSLSYVSCIAKEPEIEVMSSHYDNLVVKGKMLNKKKQTRASVRSSSAFSVYPFILWDYAEDIASGNTPSAIDHWNNLLEFIENNTITRLVTDVKDPSHFPFFGVNAEESLFYDLCK